MIQSRKKRLERRQVFPFKESSIRFGQLAVLTCDTTLLIFSPNAYESFKKSDLTLCVGDILMPIEITLHRNMFAVKCLTKHGIMHVNVRVSVKSP